MSSLRESGQIEQDADVIFLLYKEDSEDPESPRKLRIAKNKEGEQGYIRLAFDGSTQTFRELSPRRGPERDPPAPGQAPQAVSSGQLRRPLLAGPGGPAPGGGPLCGGGWGTIAENKAVP